MSVGSRATWSRVAGRAVWLAGLAGVAGLAGWQDGLAGLAGWQEGRLAPYRGRAGPPRDRGTTTPTTPAPHPYTPGYPPLPHPSAVTVCSARVLGRPARTGSGGRLLDVPAPRLSYPYSVSYRLLLAGPAVPLVKSCTRVGGPLAPTLACPQLCPQPPTDQSRFQSP